MTKNVQLKFVGELKVPWVDEHEISEAYEGETMLRHLLAQPIKYIKNLNCMHGFMSNYCETMFLFYKAATQIAHPALSLWSVSKSDRLDQDQGAYLTLTDQISTLMGDQKAARGEH